MVNVHFLQGSNDGWIHALAIPLADIHRLSLRPLKWLRFAAFAVLGSKGDLYNEPGPDRVIVDYDIVSLNDDANYFFVSNGCYSLIDDEALNDQLTSSGVTPRRADFRESVAERDGGQCVITSDPATHCDAAHIIPHAKGNAYIEFVISQRRGLYDNWNPVNDIDIDMTENGMFVRTDIRRRFGLGDSVFLKTPNFALNPDDIPGGENGAIPALRATLQHLEPPRSQGTAPEWDVIADWFGQEDAPPRLILDFMYGAAVVKRWRAPGPEMQDRLNSRHNEFASLPHKDRVPTYDDSDDDGANGDDPNDRDYVEHKKQARRRGIGHQSKNSELCQAIDDTLELSFLVRGYPPGTTVATILRKQQEEAEVHSRRIAREKVEGWLERSPDVSTQDVC